MILKMGAVLSQFSFFFYIVFFFIMNLENTDKCSKENKFHPQNHFVVVVLKYTVTGYI